MTQANKEMVHYLAKLSRIAVTKEEEELLLADLSKIIRYFEQLNEVDTTDIAPCTYLTPDTTKTPLREDVVKQSLSHDDFFKNTPDKIGGLVRVPTVLKQE